MVDGRGKWPFKLDCRLVPGIRWFHNQDACEFRATDIITVNVLLQCPGKIRRVAIQLPFTQDKYGDDLFCFDALFDTPLVPVSVKTAVFLRILVKSVATAAG